MADELDNAFRSPEAEDEVHPLVADNPLRFRRQGALGLLLWGGWLLAVLCFIVWLTG